MSVLDDARRLFADDEPIVTVGVEEAEVYAFCDRSAYPDKGHAPDCPWMSRAKIVAALEALQEIANGGDTPDAALARRALEPHDDPA